MNYYKDLSQEALIKRRDMLEEKLEIYKAQNLALNMSRGKPCTEQLEISNDMFQYMGKTDITQELDYRNYGLLDGTRAAKTLFANILEVDASEVIVGGNSSLILMYDTIIKAMLLGNNDSDKPWVKEKKVKFLCPSPGYDRHFSICESLGIEMITIGMNAYGPDMDEVERLVKEDSCIKGIWCVPKYSNPTGITYSDEVVDRLASMETAAKDFRIFWDNAYVIHHLYSEHDRLKNILAACKTYNHPNRAYLFASTSKVTFPGAGISCIAGSEANMDFIRSQMSVQTIGANKLNMAMHTDFLKDMDFVAEHMEEHAALIRPKFEIVYKAFDKCLGEKNIAIWNKPKGGYFINLDLMPGTAKAVDQLAKSLGLVLTPAGATFPYSKDPRDMNIRIAPTYPSLEELKLAMEVLCACIEYVCLNKILDND
ncbi:MAG: aminotransferase class I/II-fold pyridoxal phosphate-dependent enzyme [Vallitaleaceae bacterium]|nr:aminotransferase class I/II-fold pyridoxal phosphate-dependent enzyme [Vallitaleaceae bacterium]